MKNDKMGGRGWNVAVGTAMAAVLVAGSIERPLMAQAGPGSVPVKMMAADAHPMFEVATIKPSDPNDKSDGFHSNGRRIFIENQTVDKMLTFAYGVHGKQIVSGPDWFGTERFDIVGVPDVEGEPNLRQQQEMLQRLLTDRFGLKFHREKRELAVYAITAAKGGPKLTKSQGDPNGLPDQTGDGNGGQMTFKFTNNTMEDFALGMQFFLDRPVVNQTGLMGRWDFVLKWTPNELKAADPDGAPGMFTAIQEQLGLKLEAVKAPADVLVVDHVERPSVN
jgi:uncharacterized protein (TIGR03435 family)